MQAPVLSPEKYKTMLNKKSKPAVAPSRKAWFWKQVRVWHWVSSAIALVGMIFFAITGLTLNHAAAIPASTSITKRDAVLPEPLLQQLRRAEGKAVPQSVSSWLEHELRASLRSEDGPEWQGSELYLGLPGPGSDAWLTVNLSNGKVHYEKTSRGIVSFLNDLHKGRHSGTEWSWFIDVFSVASVVFCVTGLLLLQLHAKGRPFTWPAVAMGFVIPFLLILFFVHR